MAIHQVLADIRKQKGWTQEDLARKVFVTRQAVSRWETGQTTPGIDMIKLLAQVLEVPIASLVEAPAHFCQSCGMILAPEHCGTNADGTPNPNYCIWCYADGKYTYETDMDTMIEDIAPRMAETTDFTVEEAISLLGALLPNLKRWQEKPAPSARAK